MTSPCCAGLKVETETELIGLVESSGSGSSSASFRYLVTTGRVGNESRDAVFLYQHLAGSIFRCDGSFASRPEEIM